MALDPGAFLDATELEGADNAFTLGTLERQLTVVAQQIRALNLVEALVACKRLGADMRVAVVGGGAAGLTAAVAAAKRGANVTVFEEYSDLFSVLNGSSHRWVHPHLYDWPHEAWHNPDAGLAELSWVADSATRVAQEILAGFERERRDTPHRITVRCNCRVKSLVGNPVSGITFAEASGADQQHGADLVVLAIGFGREQDVWPDSSSRLGLDPRVVALLNRDARPYWNGEDHASAARAGGQRTYLVSGVGDGGLVDLLRVRLRDMDQVRIMDRVLPRYLLDVQQLQDRLGVLKEELDGLPEEEQAHRWTKELMEPGAMPELDARLAKERRGGTTALLLYSKPDSIRTPGLPWAGPRSFLLNRLLVARLLVLDHPHTQLIEGRFDPSEVEALGADRYRVHLRDSENRARLKKPPVEFSHLVLRHGREKDFAAWLPGGRLDTKQRAAPRAAGVALPDDRTHEPFPGVLMDERRGNRRRAALGTSLRSSPKPLDLVHALARFINEHPRDVDLADAAYRKVKTEFAERLRDPKGKTLLSPDYLVSDLFTPIESVLYGPAGRNCGAVLVACALFEELDWAVGWELARIAPRDGKELQPHGAFMTSRRIELPETLLPATRWLHVAPWWERIDVSVAGHFHELEPPPDEDELSPLIERAFAGVVLDDDGALGPDSMPHDRGGHNEKLVLVVREAARQGARMLLFPAKTVTEADVSDVLREWNEPVVPFPPLRILVAASQYTADSHACLVSIGEHQFHHIHREGREAERPMLRLALTPIGTVAVLFGSELEARLLGFLPALGIDLLLIPHAGDLQHCAKVAHLISQPEQDLVNPIHIFLATVPTGMATASHFDAYGKCITPLGERYLNVERVPCAARYA